MEQFDTLLVQTIDSTLGLRCTLFGYQYSEILRSLITRLRSQFVTLKIKIEIWQIIQNIKIKENWSQICDQLQNDKVVVTTPVESRIMSIRGNQIMIDRDLAELYGVLVPHTKLQERIKKDALPNNPQCIFFLYMIFLSQSFYT